MKENSVVAEKTDGLCEEKYIFWGPGNGDLEIWGPGIVGIWDPTTPKKSIKTASVVNPGTNILKLKYLKIRYKA